MKRVLITLLCLSFIICSSCSDVDDVSITSHKALETIACTPTDSIETNLQITVDILVGIWQNQYEVIEEDMIQYHFFEDGTFRKYYDKMGAIREDVYYSGKWRIDGNKIFLDYENRILIIGGEITEEPNLGAKIVNMVTKEEGYNLTTECVLDGLQVVNSSEISADYVFIFEEKIKLYETQFGTKDEYMRCFDSRPYWRIGGVDVKGQTTKEYPLSNSD